MTLYYRIIPFLQTKLRSSEPKKVHAPSDLQRQDAQPPTETLKKLQKVDQHAGKRNPPPQHTTVQKRQPQLNGENPLQPEGGCQTSPPPGLPANWHGGSRKKHLKNRISATVDSTEDILHHVWLSKSSVEHLLTCEYCREACLQVTKSCDFLGLTPSRYGTLQKLPRIANASVLK
ncbi:hypothetical protein BSL78_07418 [Apostichopus japonicus]|uniref:Uncharacterized protein n=1 Tax=Stichopus japonicus TaxID=307972 RepID=A0A2G8L5Z6_STIJA|nr:hypothetical protein BSL78_07418 [Apostichopus japonicus]